MEDWKRRLLETVDQDTQDLVEWRLHEHTESSMKIVAGFADQLKYLTEIIEKHDKILSGDTVDTLLKMVKDNQDAKVIADSYRNTGKRALWWLTFLTAFGAFITGIWAFLKWFIPVILTK